jgi:hypothetical protein
MGYDHLREIAVLPCLPQGLSVEDSRIEPSGPCLDIQHVMPNDAFARTLGFLNISKKSYVDLVRARRDINLLSSRAQGTETGAFAFTGRHADRWKAMQVAHSPKLPSLVTDDELVELIENASYGGQLAIAGYVDANFCLPMNMTAVRLTGRFQIGIIDYIWGSGHSMTFDGALTVDLRGGQIGGAPGYAFDDVCGFSVSYFRFDSLARAELPGGVRFDAMRATPAALAA